MAKLNAKPIKGRAKLKGSKSSHVPKQHGGKAGARHVPRAKKAVMNIADSSVDLEEAYRRTVLTEMENQAGVNHLLPIKIKGKGLVSRVVPREPEKEDVEPSDEDVDEQHYDQILVEEPPKPAPKVPDNITVADILHKRDEEIREKQFYIGTTCAAILENPDARIDNVANLLNLLGDVNREGSINFLAVRKTALVSLVEVFKDIVPEYRVGIVDKEQQKLKKDTLTRVNFENKLLTYYKQLLQHMETNTSAYTRKMRLSQKLSVETRQLLETTVQCMCDLVLAHPYFNYSPNIVQVLVLMLNNPKESVRKMVHACFSSLFKTDSRLDLTHHSLQIHRINLNEDTMLELKKQKLEKQKSYFINMSRKERKRKKKLDELEKDIFETKAEESKQVVRRKLTEISKLAFMIYFKILKCYPDSRVLSVTLEGLSKFAHTINIDFFADLVELLNNLLENAELGYREQLHCIQTVFIILSGQGEVLNIDPARFYSHFYKNLLYVNAGKNSEDMESILKTLDIILFKRRRNVTYHRYVSFVKRLSTLCLQVLPNGTLGLISLIRSCMHMNQQLDILLDTEADVGSGKFDPYNEEPEFAHANCTALYESSCLTRHYHPTVRKMITNVLKGAETVPIATGRTLTPAEFYTNYDCSEMVFNPAIPPPEKVKYGKNARSAMGMKLAARKLSRTSSSTIDVVKVANITGSSKALVYDYFVEYVNTSKNQQ
uniref:NOC3-like protein n=1 Tax=Anopheles dirus TaxID=7168 RepID=A0A182N8Y7_9DIPT